MSQPRATMGTGRPPRPGERASGLRHPSLVQFYLVLTPYDDYPIHQTADPVAHPSSGDPNHYDRYFFNGFSRNGELFFAGAMAHYPNRGIIDAAFSVVIDGVEHSVFASGSMPL